MLTRNHDILTAEVKAHIAADMVVQGTYWDGERGCFIGCLAHSPEANVLERRFGLPLPLVRICEGIFEGLPPKDARDFFASLPAAVGRDGKDLSQIHWAFLAAELRALPKTTNEVQARIDLVVCGMDKLAVGEKWDARAADVARAAAKAARAATAYYAARAATAVAKEGEERKAAQEKDDEAAHAATAYYAALAANAARAAYSRAIDRQRDTVLALISDAS